MGMSSTMKLISFVILLFFLTESWNQAAARRFHPGYRQSSVPLFIDGYGKPNSDSLPLPPAKAYQGAGFNPRRNVKPEALLENLKL
ncbi:unnamed protein product [Cyprideis torosa]|uniref:Uncharacterized protein n=1 Tax=Cyprideis torosa TaxID=163714 RepID=A0A7R8W5X7_9CRUS|nr:unnamed protein product [Cyprideis torosa]CAG0880356.1 unnamed protein product [Cyprideis torosa]